MQTAPPSYITANSGWIPKGENFFFASAEPTFQNLALQRQAEPGDPLDRELAEYFDFDAASLPPPRDPMPIPFNVDVRNSNPVASYYGIPDSQAIHHAPQRLVRHLPSGPARRQNVQNRDHLPVWKRLPTMSQEEIHRMMWQSVGLAGIVVPFGAIWRAIADYGGYANVCYQRLWKPVTTSAGLPLRCPEIVIPNYSGNGQPLRTDSMPCLLGHVFHIIFFGPKRTEEEVKETGWFPYYSTSRRSISGGQTDRAGQGAASGAGELGRSSALLSSPPGFEAMAMQAPHSVPKPPTQPAKKSHTTLRNIKPLPVRAPCTSNHNVQKLCPSDVNQRVLSKSVEQAVMSGVPTSPVNLSNSRKEALNRSSSNPSTDAPINNKKRRYHPIQPITEHTAKSQGGFTFIHVPASEASGSGLSSTSRSRSARSTSGSGESTATSSSSSLKKMKTTSQDTPDVTPNLEVSTEAATIDGVEKNDQSFESILANLPMEEFLQACADRYSADLMIDSTFVSSYSNSGSAWAGPGSDSSQSWSSSQL